MQYTGGEFYIGAAESTNAEEALASGCRFSPPNKAGVIFDSVRTPKPGMIMSAKPPDKCIGTKDQK